MKRMARIVAAGLLCVSLTRCQNMESGTDTAEYDRTETSQEFINLDGGLPIIRNAATFPRMTMVFVAQDGVVTAPEEMVMTRQLQEQTGVAFNWVILPANDALERINLMLASRDLPDVFWNGITRDVVGQYLHEGVFLPTEELTERYMPRLRSILERREGYVAEATAPDGHRYGFPYIEEADGQILTPGPFVINRAWLDACGLPVPETVEEWVQALRAFRDAGDLNGNGLEDEIPYAFGLGSADRYGTYDTFLRFAACFGQPVPAGGGSREDYLAISGGKVVFAAGHEAYRRTAELFHQLYSEGLMDPSSLSATGDRHAPYLDKLQESTAVIGCFSVWSPIRQIPDEGVREQYAPLPRLQGEAGALGFVSNTSEMRATSYCTITTDCDYPEVVAAFVDYLMEPEIAVTVNWGPEGYVFERDDLGRLRCNVDSAGNFRLKEDYASYWDLRLNTTPASGSLAILSEYRGRYLIPGQEAYTRHLWQDANGHHALLQENEALPRLIYTGEEQQAINSIQPAIRGIVLRYTQEWITQGTAYETWDDYLAELEAAGVRTMLEAFQSGYDRYRGETRRAAA